MTKRRGPDSKGKADDPDAAGKVPVVQSYALRYTNRARKDLRGLDRQIAERIMDALDELARDPYTAPNVKALKGEPGYRLRVGDYRALYTLDDGELVVLVVRVANRREAYR